LGLSPVHFANNPHSDCNPVCDSFDPVIAWTKTVNPVKFHLSPPKKSSNCCFPIQNVRKKNHGGSTPKNPSKKSTSQNDVLGLFEVRLPELLPEVLAHHRGRAFGLWGQTRRGVPQCRWKKWRSDGENHNDNLQNHGYTISLWFYPSDLHFLWDIV
jgi:hypothetical protein